MKIGFKNIRVFKELTEFEIKPITILTGPNNSGKSVMSKMLYLLKNGFETNTDGTINLRRLYFTDINKTGDFQNNLSRGSNSNTLTFKLEDLETNHLVNDFTRPFTYILEYEENPEVKNLRYSTLKEIKVLSGDKIIFNLIASYYDDIFDNYCVYYVAKHNKSNTINLRNFLIEDEYFFEADLKRMDESIGEISGYEREELNGLLSSYGDEKNILFHSYFLKLALSDENFFKNNKNDDEYTKLIKDLIGVNTHEELINLYIDFEHSFIDSVVEFIIGNDNEITEKVQSQDLFNSSFRDFSTTKLIESINSPLTKLFLLELKEKNKIMETSVPENTIESINPIFNIRKNNRNDIIPYFFDAYLVHKIQAYYFTTTSFQLPKISIFKQNQNIQEYYLENDINISNSTFYNYGKKFINNEIKKESKVFIDRWIYKLGLGDKLLVQTVKENNKIFGFTFYIKDGDSKYQLIDNGYGINKFIQILLEIALFRYVDPAEKESSLQGRVIQIHSDDFEDKILFLEEPESNLHPSLQSKLAELFAEIYIYFGVNLLIETHSEYLIRKLQYLIASNESDLDTEDVSVYYLNNPKTIPEGEKQVYKLDIRKDGFMNNDFGKGFFDEASTVSLSLLNLKKLN